MECVLAIDQGTTGSRAVLYSADGAQIASSYREFAQYFPRPGWVEHDPEEIWESVRGCIADILQRTPSAVVAAVGITNQRETAIAWDAETSEPLHNAIVWQCRRTSERCACLSQDFPTAELIRRVTGLPVDAYFSATKYEWLMFHVPDVALRALRGTLRFGTVDSWLLWKLTGGVSHATDFTNAARTMLFDIDRLSWSEELLSLFGVPVTAMPEVHSSSFGFGVTAHGCGLPPGIPITGIAGDQQAALFGQACFSPGQAKNTYGTGAFVLMNAGECRPSSHVGLITTLGCGVSTKPVYVLEGAIFAAGAVIQWLRDGLHLLGCAADSESMAESAGDNGGLYLVPALTGIGAPYWNANARGLITGITRGTTANHVVRAAIESMCYRTRDVVDAMVQDSGLPIAELRVDGGASANNFLCQFQADILGVQVIRPRDVETTARGAAYLAGLGGGFWTDLAQLDGALVVDRRFIPSMEEEQRSRLYGEWTEAVARALFRS